jgi:hypothetical protein
MPDSPTTPLVPENIFAGLGGFGAHGLDEAELRDRIGAWYASFEGLRSSGPTERDYEEHVFPRDRAAWRHVYADQAFSCALHLRALMIKMRVRHRLLDVGYEQRVGFAVSDVATVARSFGALVEGPALASYEPGAGDASCVQGQHGPHVSCFTSATWEPGARLVLGAVDGGQGRKGDMAIEKNLYLLDRRAAGPALRSVEGPAHSLDKPGQPAPVLWFVNIWKLALEAGLLKA